MGINTGDKSKPYLFQMLERLESKPVPTSTQNLSNDESSKTNLSGMQLTQKPQADKGGKMVGQIVSNKSHASENQATQQNTSAKSKKDESNTKPTKKISEPLSELKQVHTNPKSSQVTEEMDPKAEESQMDNDIFLSESVGIDVSVDSATLDQFDYNESVDLNN